MKKLREFSPIWEVALFYAVCVLIGYSSYKENSFLFSLIPAFVFAVFILGFKLYLNLKQRQKLKQKQRAEKEEKIREDIKWWLKGGKPAQTLLDVSYEFMPQITDGGGASLGWPEFQTIGGGSYNLFRKITTFGSSTLDKKDRLEWICIIGHLTDVPDWYKLSLQERGEILKNRLPADYFERNFELSNEV